MDEGGRRDQAPEPEDDRDRGVYIISVAAELVGVHPQTLRVYERKGLLSPSRTAGNTRRYSARDIARLQTIQRLTQDGVNLAGVKMIAEMENQLDWMRDRMNQMRQEMARAEARLRTEIDRVRREYRGEIVPLSEMSRLQRTLRGVSEPGPEGPPRRTRSLRDPVADGRRRTIAVGPVERRRGPFVVGPGN